MIDDPVKALMVAVRDDLRSGLASLVRSGDIYITRHESIIPAAVRPPCIGVKDGAVRRAELGGEMMIYTVQIKLTSYVQLMAAEASMLGDAAGNMGITELAWAIHQRLDERLPVVAGMTMLTAFSPDENESEWFGDDRTELQRKIIIYQYEMEGPRP